MVSMTSNRVFFAHPNSVILAADCADAACALHTGGAMLVSVLISQRAVNDVSERAVTHAGPIAIVSLSAFMKIHRLHTCFGTSRGEESEGVHSCYLRLSLKQVGYQS